MSDREMTFEAVPLRKASNGLLLHPVQSTHYQRHELPLPSDCCPVSHNPREGSTVVVGYMTSGGEVLEVNSLRALLRRFVGGYAGSATCPAIRDMEGMIRGVGLECAAALGVPVAMRADLVLKTGPVKIRRLRVEPAAC